MKHPWFKFNPTDWRADTALKMCSPISRLLWLEMIGIMHEAEPRGHFLIKGKVPTPQQLSSMLGLSVSDIAFGLSELKENEVCSTTKKGVIYSRRMVREEERTEIAKENVGRRWAKAGKIGNTKPHTKPHTKNLEVRDQKDSPDGESPRKRAPRKPEIRIPEGFPDMPALQAAKTQVAVTGAAVKITREAERFRNHAQQNDRLARDWTAAWRTWIANAIEKAPPLSAMAPAPDTIDRWPARVREWKDDQNWNRVDWGPRPGEPGCLCPPELLT